MNRKIKSIGMKNFQSWEDGEVLFENFNVLEGKSNSGKSAVVRAMSMVINDDWDSVVNELRDFKDDYGTRRNTEADLLSISLENE